MVLRSLPRYDPDEVPAVGGRAVVLGGSVAGLLAARVLADAVDRVTVLERDPPIDGPTARDGVPQGRHPHVLLRAGRRVIEDCCPGFSEDLLAAGGLLVDGLRDLDYYGNGGYLAAGPERLPLYCASRPLLEHVLRRRVAARDGVAVRFGWRGVDYRFDDRDAIDGVVAVDDAGDEREVEADLVVDATGSATRTPGRLADRGYDAPPTEEIGIDLLYRSVTVERPPGDRRVIVVHDEPPHGRGGFAIPAEGDRWLVALYGMHDVDPPGDTAEFAAFARRLPTDDLAALLENRPIATDDVASYPIPANVRRRYEDADRLPGGLVAIGDAVARVNPVYGQGMTVAAIEALQLHHALAADGLADLSDRYFARAADVVEAAWALAVGADLRFPETEGTVGTGTALFNRYQARLLRRAQTDGALADAFARVVHMERPPESLLHPAVVWRVFRPGVGR